jgi:hypothetical protein
MPTQTVGSLEANSPDGQRTAGGGFFVKSFIYVSAALMAGCVSEAEHIHPTTLPDGKPDYVITCNSQRYDRCLNRAARACNGSYILHPDARTTVRFGDPMEGVGNNDISWVPAGVAEKVCEARLGRKGDRRADIGTFPK